MTRKNNILIAVAALTICMMSAFAYAGQGPGQKSGHPCQAAYKDLSPEKQAAVDSLRKEHQQKTFALRQDEQAKKAMLNALLLAPETDKAKINQTVKELNQVRANMVEERVNHKLKMAKETGMRMPMGHGFNAGRGHGPKHGCGSGPRWCLNN